MKIDSILAITKCIVISLSVGALLYAVGVNLIVCADVVAALVVVLSQRLLESKEFSQIVVYLILTIGIAAIIYLIEKNIRTGLLILLIGVASAVVRRK